MFPPLPWNPFVSILHCTSILEKNKQGGSNAQKTILPNSPKPDTTWIILHLIIHHFSANFKSYLMSCMPFLHEFIIHYRSNSTCNNYGYWCPIRYYNSQYRTYTERNKQCRALRANKCSTLSVRRLRKIFATTMDPTSSLRLPHSTNFSQWSEEETMSWWDLWWEQKS